MPYQTAAVPGPASGNLMQDATLLRGHAVTTNIVSGLGLNALGLFKRPSAFASLRRYTLHQRHALRDVMPVGTDQNDIDRDALRINEEVVITLLPFLRRSVEYGAVFSPYTALTDELSATALEKSILSAARCLSSTHSTRLLPFACFLSGA